MKTTIDTRGRLLVPKVLREILGLKPRQLLEVRLADGKLEIEIAPASMVLERRDSGVVAVAGEGLPVLSADQVRDTLERVRR